MLWEGEGAKKNREKGGNEKERERERERETQHVHGHTDVGVYPWSSDLDKAEQVSITHLNKNDVIKKLVRSNVDICVWVWGGGGGVTVVPS